MIFSFQYTFASQVNFLRKILADWLFSFAITALMAYFGGIIITICKWS